MKSLRNTVLGLTLSVTSASFAMADDLTIAIVNNGHMINMQKVAEAYTAETGVNLNWVSLEEGVSTSSELPTSSIFPSLLFEQEIRHKVRRPAVRHCFKQCIG